MNRRRDSRTGIPVYAAKVITVHHLNNSRSQRVLWLLEELEVPYEIVHYTRDPKTMLAPPELKKIHPLGKSPVISDGETVVAESGAILEYIVETHGKGRLVPAAGTPAYRRYRYLMHYAEGSLMPFLVLKLVCNRVKTAPVPFFIKPVAKRIANGVSDKFVDPNLREHTAFLEAQLGNSEWFAGELSVADIQMSYPIESLVARGSDVGPNLRGFIDRMKARPAYKRALEKGGAYTIPG
jgi:glutathione S-transferase